MLITPLSVSFYSLMNCILYSDFDLQTIFITLMHQTLHHNNVFKREHQNSVTSPTVVPDKRNGIISYERLREIESG